MKKKAFTYTLLGINLIGLISIIVIQVLKKDFNILSIGSCSILILFCIFLCIYLKNEKMKFLNIGMVFITLYSFILFKLFFEPFFIIK